MPARALCVRVTGSTVGGILEGVSAQCEIAVVFVAI
jgi:hypothetical protein